jgi:hypothetical protein
MRSIWETERTGKACVRASSALGSSGENILPSNLQDGCLSPENHPTASAHAFLELFPFCTTAAAMWRLMQTMARLRGKIAFPEVPNGIDDRRLANPTPCGIR